MMVNSHLIQQYEPIVAQETLDQLYQLAKPLNNIKVVHVNSTSVGGGVAEILNKFVPLFNALGIEAKWEVISGSLEFFSCTRSMHDGIQGNKIMPSQQLLHIYEETNKQNAERLRATLEEADVVIVHDPQPLPLIASFPKKKGKWIWRCHIDASQPYRPLWKYLLQYIKQYDATIFSLAEFTHPLPQPMYIIPPSIDPLSEKNIELDQAEISSVYSQFDLDPNHPIILQVSRFDAFKDPLGVIEAFKLVKKYNPKAQLVLAGGTAADDPMGEVILQQVKIAAKDDPNIKILLLPGDAHRTINALQRAANIVVQKSIREGFGLTVTEGLWKGKPLIAGNTGGIKLQVIQRETGFVVNTPEGAAYRMRYLLQHPSIGQIMGAKGKEYVREKFLITRQLRDYLTVIYSLLNGDSDRMELPAYVKT
ncbi:MAG: glycosyltransferase [Leadbetterella sp.]|nr:glycosyltransferase [Leadbetterella sp.]